MWQDEEKKMWGFRDICIQFLGMCTANVCVLLDGTANYLRKIGQVFFSTIFELVQYNDARDPLK